MCLECHLVDETESGCVWRGSEYVTPHSLPLFIFRKEDKTRTGGGFRGHTKHIMNRETFEGPISEEDMFIITDKAKDSRGGGKRCRCYERRRVKD